MTKAIIMDTKQAADKIGISQNTLLNHIKIGNLKAVKNGHKYAIKASDLRTFAVKRRKGELANKTTQLAIVKPATVAKKYGVSLSTVYSNAKKGKLRSFNTDKGIRICGPYAKSLYGKH